MGFFKGLSEMFEEISNETRETYRRVRDNVECELGIDSSERWQEESKEDKKREKRKWAETMEETCNDFRREGELFIINTGTLIDTFYGPHEGAVLYCSLGPAEHSGIYVGNGEVVQLNSRGFIEKVSLKQFTDSLATFNQAVYVAFDNSSEFSECNSLYSLGDFEVKKRALEMVNKERNYSLIFDNCHQFTSGCITGNFENSDNFLWMLKDTVEKKLNNGKSTCWKGWNWIDNILFES